MKIKLDPCQSSFDSTVKAPDTNSILITKTIHEFDLSDSFPDIFRETDGEIIEAHRESGILFATVRRCYSFDFHGWYTGEYGEVTPEQVEGEFVRVKHTGKSAADIEAERKDIVVSEAKEKRNALMHPVLNRIDRYRNQAALGVSTTETEASYKALLQALEDLRNTPDQPGFPYAIIWPEIPIQG
jgi:hypothetical protein